MHGHTCQYPMLFTHEKHTRTPSDLPSTLMAHEWSYTKSSFKHQPQQTLGLHALKITNQFSCPLEQKKYLAALSLTTVHERVFP